MTVTTFIFFTLISYLFGQIYKNIWNRYNSLKVPTGFGFIYIPILLIVFVLNEEIFKNINIQYFYTISILSLIYWFDDLFGLSAILRFFIQFLAGFLISFLIIQSGSEYYQNLFLYPSFFGLLSIIFCNVINFYDGLDLNITALIVINSILIIFFSTNKELNSLTFILLAFTFGFSFLNIFPKSIYFGDSGCFIVSSYLFIVVLENLYNENTQILIVIAGVSLPIVDFIYVNIMRLYLRENLLSRNYYYLYQQFNTNFKNYSYLMLQPINTSIVIISHFFLTNLGLSFYTSLIISCFFITVLFYSICRFFILKNA